MLFSNMWCFCVVIAVIVILVNEMLFSNTLFVVDDY